MDTPPRPRNGLSLCAGGGGLDMGVMLAEPDFHTRCYVEWEQYPQQVIIAAQRAGYFAPAPIWDDVTTFDAKPLAGAIDTLLAGYPCQPFSQAGQRKGSADERHLWPDIARIARELGDGLRWIILENVAGHVTLGAETVLRELRDMGFTPAVGLFSAEEIGAPHERLRWFCVAYRDSQEPSANSGKPNAGPDGRHNASRRSRETLAYRESNDGRREHQPESEGRGRAGSARGCAELGNPTSIGRDQGRPEPIIRSGRDAIASAGSELADSGRAGLEGQQPNIDHAKGRQVQDGHARLCRRAGIFPPGPNDHDAWSEFIGIAPELAPALSLRDIKRACDHYAALVDAGQMAESEAQSILRRSADGLAFRSRILKLLGNGVVPLQAAYAVRTLLAAHGVRPLDMGAAGTPPCNRTDDAI